jgi:hypothetical protein
MSPRHSIPLGHRVRRRILRQLHSDFSQHSIDDLARELCLNTSEVGYHGEVLARWKTVSRTEGPNGFLLESLVTEDSEVVSLLISTGKEDESVPSDPGKSPRLRAGVSGLTVVALVLSDPPLRECLAALAQEEGTPGQLAGRLDLDEDVVRDRCSVLVTFGLAERV